jgi:hypothetical protein
MELYKVIDNLLDIETCQYLIDLSEKEGYKEADITYSSGAKMNKEYRNNSRVLYKNEDLRLKLEKVLSPHIPLLFPYIKEGGTPVNLNFLKLSGNFRFYKYMPDEDFKKHRDSSQFEEGGISLITVLFYLNTPEYGGETGIYDYDQPKKLIKAETGKVLWFDHVVAHTGERVIKGCKYVLRSDFIYENNIYNELDRN